MKDTVIIDLEVSPKDVPYQAELSDTQNFGIHSHKVHKDDVDTDEMFANSPIVSVQWFETEAERNSNMNQK